MTQLALDERVGDTSEEAVAMETGTLLFTIQRPPEAFTCIELAMKMWTNDLNRERFQGSWSNEGFQTSLGLLRSLGQSSPRRKISIKRNLYDVAFILSHFSQFTKNMLFYYLQDRFLDSYSIKWVSRRNYRKQGLNFVKLLTNNPHYLVSNKKFQENVVSNLKKIKVF